MSRSTAALFLPVVALLALGAALYTKPWHNLSLGGIHRPPALNVALPSGGAATSIKSEEEARFAEQWMASAITTLDQGRANAKAVSGVRCTRATAWPSTFARGTGHAYDCIANFNNTRAKQRWCVLFDPINQRLGEEYQGAKMCEGPPNPTIEP